VCWLTTAPRSGGRSSWLSAGFAGRGRVWHSPFPRKRNRPEIFSNVRSLERARASGDIDVLLERAWIGTDIPIQAAKFDLASS
jgi:hypothetical protein